MHVKKRELCLRKHLNVYFQWQPRVSVCCLAFKARLIPSAHQATQGWRGREMDSLLSCTDSLGLARIAVHSELTSCYQLFSCGRDWNKQSRGLIHCVCAMPGGISAVMKCSPSDISIFHTSLEFARCFSTCCGPETDSWDLTGTTGTFLWVSELWGWQIPQRIWLLRYFHLLFLENRTVCFVLAGVPGVIPQQPASSKWPQASFRK